MSDKSSMSSLTMFSGDFSDDEWPNENWPEMEFRSPEDEAWYGVEVWSLCNDLVVNFNGFSHEYDEVYPLEDFKNSEQIQEFEERFRVCSVQMQDLECPIVSEGTKVCATCPSDTGEVKFYDAIMVGVERSKHGWDEDGSEVCGCEFRLYWKQGPCVGQVTSAKIGDICLKSEDSRVNPKVFSFLKEARRQIHGGASSSHQGAETEWQKTLRRVTSALRNYNLSSSVSENQG